MPYIAVVVHATCCGHPVAEVMLVLWALGHLIEGASGFGTGPATLTREPLLARVAAATAGMCAPSQPRSASSTTRGIRACCRSTCTRSHHGGAGLPALRVPRVPAHHDHLVGGGCTLPRTCSLSFWQRLLH